MGLITNALESFSKNVTLFKVVKLSSDKKFGMTDDNKIINVKNIGNAITNGILQETAEDTFALVKGRAFTDSDGFTWFTDKDKSLPSW